MCTAEEELPEPDVVDMAGGMCASKKEAATTNNTHRDAPTSKSKRPKVDATTPSHVERVVHDLLKNDKLHTPSPSPTGYRNKVSYNLFDFQTSPIGLPAANSIACSVAKWVDTHAQPSVFWKEVSVKVTRSGGSMIRLTLCTDDIAQWDEAQRRAFVKFMKEEQPLIESMYYQVSATNAKPTKHDEYHLLEGNPYVYETTPNGLQFLVSPDTFTGFVSAWNGTAPSSNQAGNSDRVMSGVDPPPPPALSDH